MDRISEVNQQLLMELDPKSRAVIAYISEYRHASLQELLSITGDDNHMEVLLQIREVINPTAKRVLGSTILEFRENYFDVQDGKRSLFSWWLVSPWDNEDWGNLWQPDIYYEKDVITVLMPLFGAEAKQVEINPGKGSLHILLNHRRKQIEKNVTIPLAVRSVYLTKSENNGILVITLAKEGDRNA